jgi:glutamyl-tRNA synthetase
MRHEQQIHKLQPHYDGLCRMIDPDEAAKRMARGEKYIIRFKMQKEGSTTAHDLLRGDIVVENVNIDDYVLLKSDGYPTYHLAAMVDDHLMEITHVLRGSEWLGTFPLHVNIVRAFGWEEPEWVHLSVFLKPSGKGKMSKREASDAIKDGYSIFIKDLQDLGFMPEGVLNWIVLMGWGVAEGDVLTLKDMIEKFDLEHLNPSPAAINFTKLDHFNGTHIRLLPDDELAARIKPFFLKADLPVEDARLLKIIPLIRERLVTLDDCLSFGGFFFKDLITPEPEELIGKGLDAKQSVEISRKTYEILSNLPNLNNQTAEPEMRAYVEQSGFSANQVFGILRVAVTGQKVSPPLFETLKILGSEKVLFRVHKAIEILEKML